MKRGISLLEVLFAIFILSVGLLGLFSLVPVGSYQVSQATIADRAGACGQAAQSEFKIRGMGDADLWCRRDGTQPTAYTTFFLDPLSVTSNNSSLYDAFPYGGPVAFPRMERLTLRRQLTKGNPYVSPPILPTYAILSQPVCASIFSWADDLVLHAADDGTSRPTVLTDATGNTLPTSRQSGGDFTWAAMVSLPARHPSDTSAQQTNVVRVSIVVFHKRDLVYDATSSVMGERIGYCDILGGGGDVSLRDTVSTTKATAEENLKVRPHHWVLLAGQQKVTFPQGVTTIGVYKWYRVVTTSAITGSASSWTVDVTLAGPDLEPARFVDSDSDNTTAPGGATLYAIICDDVVGVFEKTIQLDESSLWAL